MTAGRALAHVKGTHRRRRNVGRARRVHAKISVAGDSCELSETAGFDMGYECIFARGSNGIGGNGFEFGKVNGTDHAAEQRGGKRKCARVAAVGGAEHGKEWCSADGAAARRRQYVLRWLAAFFPNQCGDSGHFL